MRMYLRSIACIGLLVAFAGCGDDSVADSGIDAGVDLSIALPAQPTVLCASSACATAPCTAGCRFKLVVATCPSDLPVVVQRPVVAACAGFCTGVRNDATQPTHGGYCYRYDASLPGLCQVPTCGWNSDCEIHSFNYGENEATICAAGDACYDGRPADDMAAVCLDMSTHD